MQPMDWLLLVLFVVIGCFFFVFLFWRAATFIFHSRKKRRGAMSRGRIVWSVLGGLSVILAGCFAAWAEWHSGEPPRDFVLESGVLFWFAWGAAEIAIALRAGFARKRV